MAGNLKITLKKSPIGRPDNQRRVLLGLGLTKVNKAVVRKDTPEIRGMVNKVGYMLAVEETD